MNKSDLVSSTAEKAGLSKTAAKKAINAITAIIEDSLAKGDKVALKGFGTFNTRNRPLRRIWSLHDQRMITVPASSLPVFKPGKNLKTLIKETPGKNDPGKQEENQKKLEDPSNDAFIKPDTRPPKVIAVTSGKGGTGKTNFVINIAIALAQRGQKVYLIDADLGTANVDVLLGLHCRHTINTLVEDKSKDLMDIIVEGPEGIRIIPGGSGLQSLAELPREELARIISMFKPLEEYADVIMIDTGAGISRNVIEFALAADEIVIVITPEPHSISDAYAIIKVLQANQIQPPIKLVFNLVENSTEAKMVSSRLTDVTERFLQLKPETIGYIVKDDNVVKSVKQFKPFVLYNPLAPASKCIVPIAEKLIPSSEEKQVAFREEKKGFIGKLKTLFASPSR